MAATHGMYLTESTAEALYCPLTSVPSFDTKGFFGCAILRLGRMKLALLAKMPLLHVSGGELSRKDYSGYFFVWVKFLLYIVVVGNRAYSSVH